MIINKDLIDRAIILPTKDEYINRRYVEAIDEIISYQPLYSTRKQMQEKGYEYTVEKMKDTVIHILNMYFGRNNGQEK